MKRFIEAGAIAGALLLPQFAFAVTTLKEIFCAIGTLINLATPIVVSLALLGFFWGLAMYMFSLSGAGGTAHNQAYGMPASPQGQQTGRSVMFYGIVVLFVMFSIWGLVNILQSTFGVGGGSITPPSISGHAIQNARTQTCPR